MNHWIRMLAFLLFSSLGVGNDHALTGTMRGAETWSALHAPQAHTRSGGEHLPIQPWDPPRLMLPPQCVKKNQTPRIQGTPLQPWGRPCPLPPVKKP